MTDAARRSVTTSASRRDDEVVCATADGAACSSYAGGWPPGGGVFVIDRIRVGHDGATELLGGARVAARVRGVLGGDGPTGRVMTMRDAPIR